MFEKKNKKFKFLYIKSHSKLHENCQLKRISPEDVSKEPVDWLFDFRRRAGNDTREQPSIILNVRYASMRKAQRKTAAVSQ